MIIEFNPKIFESEDKNIQMSLADILVILPKKEHFVSMKGIVEIFFKDYTFTFKNTRLAKDYLSVFHLQDLERFFTKFVHGSAYITQLYRQHISTIIIGSNEGEIHPVDAVRLLQERSILIVENGINDWTFLEGVCQKYTDHKLRGSIYKLIKKAINNDSLESIHCGGYGEIEKITDKWINGRYRNTQHLKLMVLFDSDKLGKGMDTQHTHLIKYFKKTEYLPSPIPLRFYEYEPTDLVRWHILYKRKLENYVPVSAIVKYNASITDINTTALLAKTADELDYMEYNEGNINLSKKEIKHLFPKLFTYPYSYKDLEARCSEHFINHEFLDGVVEKISELELILLKIAKII